MLERVGVRDLERQRMLSLRVCRCVCVRMLDGDMDREISLPQQVCPLALFPLDLGIPH